MASSNNNSRKTFNEINITPLTDIFLVLLIIMMVVAPMLDYQGLKLSVPSMGPSEEITEDPKVIRVAIDEAGLFLVNDEATEGKVLGKQIKGLIEEFPEGMVIEANPDSSHEALTAAMDAAQWAGITKLAVTSSTSGEGDDGEYDDAMTDEDGF